MSSLPSSSQHCLPTLLWQQPPLQTYQPDTSTNTQSHQCAQHVSTVNSKLHECVSANYAIQCTAQKHNSCYDDNSVRLSVTFTSCVNKTEKIQPVLQNRGYLPTLRRVMNENGAPNITVLPRSITQIYRLSSENVTHTRECKCCWASRNVTLHTQTRTHSHIHFPHLSYMGWKVQAGCPFSYPMNVNLFQCVTSASVSTYSTGM